MRWNYVVENSIVKWNKSSVIKVNVTSSGDDNNTNVVSNNSNDNNNDKEDNDDDIFIRDYKKMQQRRLYQGYDQIDGDDDDTESDNKTLWNDDDNMTLC